MLIAEEAARRGLPAVLAGRDREAVTALGEWLGLESRIASLDDRDALGAALDGITVVVHCAGPFVRTARPMVDACLARRVHYLDVTGEVQVFAALHRRSAEAVEAGILVMPGVGFDVVPSDGLAAHLATGVPDIEVYMAAPPGLRFFLRASRVLGPMLASAPVQRLLRSRIRRGPPGPSAAEREAGSSHLWGELIDDRGNLVSARLHGPEGYSATVLCALEICQRVLAGERDAGFHMPAGLDGPDLALDAAGFTREDLETA